MKKKALVVDDDDEVLAFVAEALTSFVPGFDVVTSRSFDEAVLWLGVFAPDVVLLDPRLCGSDLRELTRRLFGDPLTRHCKIVVSHDPTSSSAPDSSQIGAHAVLSKPLRLQDLLITVRNLVDLGPAPGRGVGVEPLARNWPGAR